MNTLLMLLRIRFSNSHFNGIDSPVLLWLYICSRTHGIVSYEEAEDCRRGSEC
jgi:hypothetical protein